MLGLGRGRQGKGGGGDTIKPRGGWRVQIDGRQAVLWQKYIQLSST